MSATLAFPQSLADEFKPQTLAEFVGLEKHRKILSKLAENPYPCALLFHGGPGTGKTSMAFAFAREIGAEIHQIASQEANVDAVKAVVDTCHRVPYDFETGTPRKWHVVIVDEADRMSPATQLYLLSKLDGTQPCPATIWIFTCNTIESFQDRFISRTVQLPKFNGYGSGDGVRLLLSRIWKERAGDVPEPDYSKVPTGNVRDALQWLEIELLAA